MTPGTAHHASILEMLSPRTSVNVPVPRKSNPGRYYCYSIPPGGEQDVHVDLRQNVLMHVSVEEINMRSTKWSLCSWAQRPGRHDSSQYATKLPKEVQLRLVGVGMPLPTDVKLIAPYLLRLKDAGALLGTVHRQFVKDARTAVTSEDVQAAVGRVKAFARRMGKVGSKNMNRALSKTSKAVRGTPSNSIDNFYTSENDRPRNMPVPPRPMFPPMAPPADGGVEKKKPPRRSFISSRWSRNRRSYASIELPPLGDSQEMLASSATVQALTGGADFSPSGSSAGPSNMSPSSQQGLLYGTKRLSDNPIYERDNNNNPVNDNPIFEHSPAEASSSYSSQGKLPVSGVIHVVLPTVEEDTSVPGEGPSGSSFKAQLPPATRSTAGYPPRPPPLEISEPVLENILDPSTGMVPTPFDVWRQPSAGAAGPAPVAGKDGEEIEVPPEEEINAEGEE